MDLPTSIYMVNEELGAKTKWLQLNESVVKLPKLTKKGMFLCLNVERPIRDYGERQPVNDL